MSGNQFRKSTEYKKLYSLVSEIVFKYISCTFTNIECRDADTDYYNLDRKWVSEISRIIIFREIERQRREERMRQRELWWEIDYLPVGLNRQQHWQSERDREIDWHLPFKVEVRVEEK